MTIKSHPVEIFDRFKTIVGPKNYIDDTLKMDAYVVDWGNQFRGFSPLILKPINTQMVSSIMALCNVEP